MVPRPLQENSSGGLGLSWRGLGSFLGALGPSLEGLGALWGLLEVVLGCLWGLVGPLGTVFAAYEATTGRFGSF